MRKCKVLVLIPELEDSHKATIKEILSKGCEVYFDEKGVPLSEIDALLIFRFEGVVSHDLLDSLENLKLIQAITAGIDHIPSEKLALKGIRVQGAHGANSHFIAEHAFAMILSAIKKICYHTECMRKGEFHQEEMHRTLFDKNLLILGFGSIGQEIARIAQVFEMKIRVFKRTKDIPYEWKGKVEKVYIDKGELEEAWPWADYIVIALPLDESTKGLIGANELALMKNDAVLVNVARGKIINEEALYQHLLKNPDFIACLDTWWVYPKEGEVFRQHYDFHKLPNVITTPHVAPKVPGFFENMLRKACTLLLESLKEG